MAPWVGRLRHGLLRFGGQTHRFEQNLGEHAIHGVAFDAPWQVEEQRGRTLVLGLDLDVTQWQLGGRIRQTIQLAPGRLAMRAELTSTKRSMPSALGWHPWFVMLARSGIELHVPADRVLVTDDELLPAGHVAPVDAETDLREALQVADRRLDHVFVGVREATLRWPDLHLSIRASPSISAITVCVRDGCVCVEPQTAWPDAPTLAARGIDSGLVVLEPGERLAAEQVWSWQARPAASR